MMNILISTYYRIKIYGYDRGKQEDKTVVFLKEVC